MYFHSKGAMGHQASVIKTRDAIAGQTGMAHALWDPFVYCEDGKRYLFYAVAGEHGIGLAVMSP